MAERKKRSEFNAEQKEIADELDAASALEAVSASTGGKLLSSALVSDVVDLIDALGSKYRTLTHLEFISLCADMKTKLDLMRSLSRAKKNKDYLKEILEEKLKE